MGKAKGKGNDGYNAEPHEGHASQNETNDIRLEFDLTCLYESDGQMGVSCEETEKRCRDFCGRYESRVHELGPDGFYRAMMEYEEISEEISKAMTYAFLNFAVDSKKYGGMYADCELKCSEMMSKIMFFEVEFCELDQKRMDAMIERGGKYRYYLQCLKDSKCHRLSLKEERIMMNVSPVGASAFSRLFDESLSNLRFRGVLDSKTITEEEILALLHNKDRDVRKKAQDIFTRKIKQTTHLLTYIMNVVRKDLAITKGLRGYEKPESFRHIENKATQKSVDCLVKCVNKNVKIVHEYYEIKGKILGIQLRDYDRYAPLCVSDRSQSVSFREGLNLVLDAFQRFDPVFVDIANKAIAEGWISSHPDKNKRGGAFSHGAVPSAHPFVLLNYTGNRRDVFTIAHEFGHMVHQELSKSLGVLNMDTPLTTAETASVFAEMLLFDSMKEKMDSKSLLEMYAGKIEDIFSTLFRQIVMTNFERRIHDLTGEISTDTLDSIWREENKKMFGKSVRLSKNYSRWWSYIPHFIHSPFYCYAYSYGQLLVLALFGLYKGGDRDFKEKYLGFLKSGGSKSPRDLVSEFGFDVEEPQFWNIGMEEVRKMVAEFRELLDREMI